MREVARDGKDGITRWMYDGFVSGERRRQRWDAVCLSVDETRAATWGNWQGRHERGGVARRVSRSWEERGRHLGLRRGGRRRRRETRPGERNSGAGSAEDELEFACWAWCFDVVGRESVFRGWEDGSGTREERDEMRMACLAWLRRCWFSSCSKNTQGQISEWFVSSWQQLQGREGTRNETDIANGFTLLLRRIVLGCPIAIQYRGGEDSVEVCKVGIVLEDSFICWGQ